MLLLNLLLVLGSQTALAEGGSSTTGGIANPASEKCVSVGGVSVLVEVDAAGAQMGLCQLSRGSLIEEWTLFRHLIQTSNMATRAVIHAEPKFYGDINIQKAAIEFCSQLGQKVILIKKQGLALCEFQDRSIIEVKTLFLGSAKANKKLMQVLSKKVTPRTKN